MIQKILGAAAVVYAVVSNIYGNADAANLGVTTIDADWLVYGLPAIAGSFYPFLGKLTDRLKGLDIKLPNLVKGDVTSQLKEIETSAKAANDALKELYQTMDQVKDQK